MTEDRDALLQHYRQMRAGLLAAIEGLDDVALSEPSLDGWSVKYYLAHISLWDEIRAGEMARISAGFNSAWQMTPDREEMYGILSHSLRVNLTPDQARWELATTYQRLLDAIAATTPNGLDASRYGEAGLLSTHEAIHPRWIERWRKECQR